MNAHSLLQLCHGSTPKVQWATRLIGGGKISWPPPAKRSSSTDLTDPMASTSRSPSRTRSSVSVVLHPDMVPEGLVPEGLRTPGERSQRRHTPNTPNIHRLWAPIFDVIYVVSSLDILITSRYKEKPSNDSRLIRNMNKALKTTYEFVK